MNTTLPLSLILDVHCAIIRGDLPAARAALLRLSAAADAVRLSLPDVPASQPTTEEEP